VLELTVKRRAKDILAACKKRGLVVKLDTVERKRMARHWHVGFEKQPGVLEITDLGDSVVLKVAARRDGGWAEAFAHELADKKQ
jgi:hypothetical protein